MKNHSESEPPFSNPSMKICPHCKAIVREKRLDTHIAKKCSVAKKKRKEEAIAAKLEIFFQDTKPTLNPIFLNRNECPDCYYPLHKSTLSAHQQVCAVFLNKGKTNDSSAKSESQATKINESLTPKCIKKPIVSKPKQVIYLPVSCPHCNAKVSGKNLDKHVQNKCPVFKQKTQKPKETNNLIIKNQTPHPIRKNKTPKKTRFGSKIRKKHAPINGVRSANFVHPYHSESSEKKRTNIPKTCRFCGETVDSSKYGSHLNNCVMNH